MIDPAILDAMVSAGCTAEQVAAVVKAALASGEERRASKRETNAERQRRFRERNKSNALHGVTGVNNDGVVSPKKETSPTPPKEKTTPSVVSEPDGSSTIRSEPVKPAPNAIIGLPTVSDGDFPIFEADISEWSQAFPAVDVHQQLAAMRQWLLANSTRRKTKRGMRKFVVSWLDRRQNAGLSPHSQSRSTAPPTGRTVSDALADIAAGNWPGRRGENHEPDYIETSYSRRN